MNGHRRPVQITARLRELELLFRRASSGNIWTDLLVCPVRPCSDRASQRTLAWGAPAGGPDSWADMLRRHGRCTKCGQRGLTLSHAGWGGMKSAGGRKTKAAGPL